MPNESKNYKQQKRPDKYVYVCVCVCLIIYLCVYV